MDVTTCFKNWSSSHSPLPSPLLIDTSPVLPSRAYPCADICILAHAFSRSWLYNFRSLLPVAHQACSNRQLDTSTFTQHLHYLLAFAYSLRSNICLLKLYDQNQLSLLAFHRASRVLFFMTRTHLLFSQTSLHSYCNSSQA